MPIKFSVISLELSKSALLSEKWSKNKNNNFLLNLTLSSLANSYAKFVFIFTGKICMLLN